MADKKEIPNLILNNADNLLDTARILLNNNKMQHAGHFAVYSIEESMKSVMKYAEFYHIKDLSDHYKKEDMLSIIYYIIGQLSVVYLFEKLAKSEIGDSTWRSTTKQLSDLLATKATDISYKTHEKMKGAQKQYKIVPTYKLDKIRKNSVYSNSNTGEIEVVDKIQIHESIKMATFASAFIRMLINEEFTWEGFFKIAPEGIKKNITTEAEELIKKLKQSKDK